MKSFKKIWSYVRKYKYLAILPILSITVTVVLDMLNPYYTKVLIDDVIGKHQLNLLNGILLTLLCINIGKGILVYLRYYLFEMVSENSMLDLKYDLYNHIEHMPFTDFDNNETGELMSRLTNDIDNIKAIIAYGFSTLCENILYFGISLFILLRINVGLTILAVLSMPFVAFFAFRFEKVIDKIWGKSSDQAAKLNSTAEQNIAGMRVVKAFARKDTEIRKFESENNSFLGINIEMMDILAKYLPVLDFFGGFSAVVILLVGGILVINKTITIGQMVEFNGYIWMLIYPMRSLGWVVNMFAQSKASAEKVNKIFDIKTEEELKTGTQILENVKGRVKFDHVSYDIGNRNILNDINFDVKEGRSIAIMGETGSGKTSIINLIGRFYEASSGSITIDGVNIKDIELKNLRSNLGVVMQDTFLFSDTIAQNIAFGAPDATMDDIIRAAKIADVDRFVSELSDGYDTIIGERGLGLSGGQKQRIAIARAIIKDPKILILDDATSAVDMQTEKEIHAALQNVMKNRTTFIIAHRVSSVKDADEIIMLKDGKIAERGTHEELIDKNGLYKAIFNEQVRAFNFVDEEAI